MDGPELIARDLALLATTNPEAFWSALHELHDALAKGAHPDAELLDLDAELHALCEAVHAGPVALVAEHVPVAQLVALGLGPGAQGAELAVDGLLALLALGRDPGIGGGAHGAPPSAGGVAEGSAGRSPVAAVPWPARRR